MSRQDNITKFIRFLYDEKKSASEEKIEILFDNLSKGTLELVLDEIEAKLIVYIEQSTKQTEDRILAHMESLPDDNKYKEAIKKVKNSKNKAGKV